MTTCEMCGENVAAVFTPTIAICKPCRRELTRMEIEDNAVPNGPTCATDGAVLNASGTCPECVVRSLRGGHFAMGRAS